MMGARYRICETCVYCSFAGNCDRYDKPLTSIEQPACDAYEIHPLLAENAKLRELVADLMPVVCSGCHERLCEMPKEEHPFVECLFADRARELGIEVTP